MDDNVDNNGATDDDDNNDGNGATDDNSDGDGKGDGATDNNGDTVLGDDDDGDVQRVTTMTMMAMDNDDGVGVMDGQLQRQ